jgi:hypothetical protein
MKIKDIAMGLKNPNDITSSEDSLKQIEKVLFQLEQMDIDSHEDQIMRDSLIADIEMNLPRLQYQVDFIKKAKKLRGISE